MPTKNPRVMTVLDPSLREWLKKSAEKEGISVSLMLRDIVKEAKELAEDRYWSRVGEERLKTFNRKKAVSHEDAWEK